MWRRKRKKNCEDELIIFFTNLSVPKNLAKTLDYILEVDEWKTKDIEYGAEIKQPEVSVAMEELRKRGWISKRKSRENESQYLFYPMNDIDVRFGPPNEYNVFVYDTVKYPPKCIPPESNNT